VIVFAERRSLANVENLITSNVANFSEGQVKSTFAKTSSNSTELALKL